MHAYMLCFSKFHHASIYREKKQNANSSYSCGQVRPFLTYFQAPQTERTSLRQFLSKIFFSHIDMTSASECRLFLFLVSEGWGWGVGGWDELQLDRKEDMNESNKLSCKHLLHNFQLMTEQSTVDYLRRSTTCETTHSGFNSRLKVCVI